MKKNGKDVIALRPLEKVLLSLQNDDDAVVIEPFLLQWQVQQYFSSLSLEELEIVLKHIRDHKQGHVFEIWQRLESHVERRIADRVADTSNHVSQKVHISCDARRRGGRLTIRLPLGATCSFWESELPPSTIFALKQACRRQQKPS